MPSSKKDTPNSRASTSKSIDLITRGDYTPTPYGKLTFVLLRAIDPYLQYSILRHGLGTPLLHRLGIQTLPPGPPTPSGIPLIDALQLTPYRLVLLLLSVGSAAKQNIWVTALSHDPMPVSAAVAVGLYNAFWNSVASYAFLVRATSTPLETDFPQPALVLGCALYSVGLLVELGAEVQRKRFKSRPENQGKAFTGGLWALARHINYGGYTLWRAGYAMVGGGYVLGALVGGVLFWDFSTRGVPILNEYCEKRYGQAWEKFKRDTPWKLIPWVY